LALIPRTMREPVIFQTMAFRSPSSERGVSRGCHPRSVLPETTNTTKPPGGTTYPRQLSTRSGQSGHAAWKDWGGTLNLHARQLRAQRPIGTRCAGDCGGLMSACFCRHFWPAIFGRQFLAGIFARRAHKGPIDFFASVSPFQRGKGGCRQTLLRCTPKGEP
jgi:hypothetical protein